MIRFFALACAALALSACTEPSGGDSGGSTGSTPMELSGNWRLVELKGNAISDVVTLEFGESNAIGGDAPCNRYFGSYTAMSDFSFSTTEIGATRRACPSLSNEVIYFDALDKATQYRPGREGDTFALLDDAGVTLASYVKAEALDLDGDWRVTQVLTGSGLTSGPELSGVGLTFSGGNAVSGNLGCNNISGQYEHLGESLTFDAIAVTARACFAPAPFEQPILDLLPQVRSVASSTGQVRLLGDTGQTLIGLAR